MSHATTCSSVHPLYPCHSWIFKWVAWAVRDQSEFNLRIIFSWEPSAGLTYMDKVALLVSRGLWGGEDTGRHCAIASIVFLSPPPPPNSPRPLASPSKMAEIKSFLLLSSVILSMDLSFSARIAGFSGFYSGSHYFTIKKVMEELFSRGHEVRVFRTRCGPNCRK